jgi:hypothetical protein
MCLCFYFDLIRRYTEKICVEIESLCILTTILYLLLLCEETVFLAHKWHLSVPYDSHKHTDFAIKQLSDFFNEDAVCFI